MEVRVQKQKNRASFNREKLHNVWKILAGMLAVCVLAGGIVLWSQQKPSLAALTTSYDMEIDSDTGKPIFHVVEVVPEKNLAVMNLFIGGEEGKTISMERLLEEVPSKWGDIPYWATNFIYWEGKTGSKGNEPFSLVYENGKNKKIINNEIFKLYMLGNGKYDTAKSVYQNYLDNQDVLRAFNENYIIKYQIVTPKELDTMNLDKVNYIQIGASDQIGGYPSFGSEVGILGSVPWHQAFNEDISWGKALDIYKRVLAKSPRLSISISSYSIVQSGIGLKANMYRLYQMLNYFDDPSVFETLIKKDDAKPYPYISLATGIIYADQYNKSEQWDDSFLPMIAGNNSHVSVAAHRELNYIPEKYDNILVYNKESGYFDQPLSSVVINQILQPSGGTPPAGDIPPVSVLEIEPGTDFRFEDTTANVESRKTLAGWLGVTADSLDVTCVTPNELNGLTVDLISEYDMIYVGERTGTLGAQTRYLIPETYPLPYQHIGAYADSIVTQPLINGLLDKDKTTSAEFKTLAGKALKKPPTGKFLKNTELALELGENIDGLGHSRFSGNDITVYMKEQLQEYITSGQPVVAGNTVCERSYELQEDLNKKPTEQKNFELDSNLYAVFAEAGLSKNGTAPADPNPTNNNVFNESLMSGTSPLKGLLKNLDKPEIMISGSSDAEGAYILDAKEAGSDDEHLVTSLQKSDGPAFTYTLGNLKPGAAYKMKVIVDQNGDGIFDERKKNQTAEKDQNEDVVQTIELTDISYAGDFTWSGKINSGKSVCQFRVIVQEEGTNGLRAVWTGYMRPNLSSRPVKILQIMSDGTENKLSEQTEFMELLGGIEETLKDYQLTAESFVSVTTTQFGAQYADAAALDAIDLIIVGFDYGTHDADMTPNALKALDDYINVKKKPVIFTKDSISYVNMEYYMAPEEAKYVWRKVTLGDLTPGVELVDDGINFRRSDDLTEEEYNGYVLANEHISEKEDPEWIYLEPLKEQEKQGYEEIFLPVAEEKFEDGRKEKTLELGTSVRGNLFNTIIWSSISKNFTGKDGKKYSMNPNQVKDVFEKNGYWTETDGRSVLLIFTYENYKLHLGWITKDEYDAINNSTDTVQAGTNSGKKTFYLKEFVLNDYFVKTKTIPETEIVTKKNPDGSEYYLHHDKYLARKINGTVKVNTSAYWEMRVPLTGSGAADEKEYQIVPVAGTAGALYPERANWGFRMAQSLRYSLGMDRFGITITEEEKKDKENKKESRDSGTTRELTHSLREQLKELQGFTNGALLEFACIKDGNGNAVVQHEPYRDPLAALGSAPRTDAIETLNQGVIGQYPFLISADDTEPIKISAGQHAPYYQLDLERTLREGKTDDVTVWYTLGGSETEELKNSSKYFSVTKQDAGNNYYLYSKGNVFYTGYNLPENLKAGDPPALDQQSAQETEMKLFINTIYAALSSSSSQEVNTPEAVVKADGTVSCIERAGAAGSNNQYAAYYEEGDRLVFNFRVQSKAPGGEVKVTFGLKTGTDTDGSLLVSPLTELPARSVTVEAAPEEAAGSDGGLSNDTGNWYQLELTLGDREEQATTAAGLDGKVLVIGVGEAGSAGTPDNGLKLGKDAIHAEIRLVLRNLFDLD